MANNADSQLSNGAGSSGSNSSLLSGIGGVAGSLSGIVGSLLSYGMNRDLANERNQQAIEQWYRENAYNHPREQLKRLREAGLNPGLMYSNGASGLVSASSPEMTMGAPANIQGVDPLTAAQIENLNAQTESVRDSNIRENAKQPFNIQLLHDSVEKVRSEVDNLKASYDNILKEGGIKDYELVSLIQKTEEEAAIFYDRIRRFYIETDKHQLEADKLKKELEFLPDTLESLINLNWQHADYYKKSGSASSSRAETYASEVANKLKEIEGQLDRWDDMTTNERIQMGVSLFGQILSLGKSLFTTSRVTETIKQAPNGTTRTYSRKRQSK